MNDQEKIPKQKKVTEKSDDFDEIKEFLRKKKIQNDVLKKLIDKSELSLTQNKNIEL